MKRPVFNRQPWHMQLTGKNHFELNYFELLKEFNTNPMNIPCIFFDFFPLHNAQNLV